MKNLTRKLLTVLMAVALVFTSVNTVKAVANDDEATVKIEGLEAGDVVTLYKIGSGKYEGTAYQGMEYAKGLNDGKPFADVEKPTSQEINAIANAVNQNTLPEGVSRVNLGDAATVPANGTFQYTAESGAVSYLAIVTPSDASKRVYNPILLQASYKDDNGTFVLDSEGVDLTGDTKKLYQWGETSLAKWTEPNIDKKQTVTSVKDVKFVWDDEKKEYVKTENEDIDTISIGDVVHYTITPTMPQYSAQAKYKALWIEDNMDEGLTYDHDSLKVTWNGEVLVQDGDYFYKKADADKEHPVAKVTKNANGFGMSFDYEQLRAAENGQALQPVVTYDAVINENAVVGHEGNWNHASMKYNRNPNEDKTWTVEDTKEGHDLEEKKKETRVFTFDFVILKTDENNNPITNNPAKFGVYADEECTELIEVLETNANGYATSSLYSALQGTKVVWIKEIEQPTGYSIDTEAHKIEMNWKTCNTESSKTVVTRTYTTLVSEAIDEEQVGWLFLEKEGDTEGEFRSLSAHEGDETKLIKKAYLKSTTTQEEQSSETLTNNVDGGGTFYYGNYKNTKTPVLPSTGGVGTYIFTIAGVAILATAAFMLIFRKREDA